MIAPVQPPEMLIQLLWWGLRHLYLKKTVFSVLLPQGEDVEALLWAAQQTLPQRGAQETKAGRVK